jgi:hypothetical protein
MSGIPAFKYRANFFNHLIIRLANLQAFEKRVTNLRLEKTMSKKLNVLACMTLVAHVASAEVIILDCDGTTVRYQRNARGNPTQTFERRIGLAWQALCATSNSAIEHVKCELGDMALAKETIGNAEKSKAFHQREVWDFASQKYRWSDKTLTPIEQLRMGVMAFKVVDCRLLFSN